jgi:hypothetical protein
MCTRRVWVTEYFRPGCQSLALFRSTRGAWKVSCSWRHSPAAALQDASGTQLNSLQADLSTAGGRGLRRGERVMLRGLNDLKRLTIAAKDGPLGSISDLYLDDRSWAVSYLVVDTDDGVPGRRVLVPPVPVRHSEPTTIRLAWSKQQIQRNSGEQALRVDSVISEPACAGEPESLTCPKPGAVRTFARRPPSWARDWTVHYFVIDTGQWWAGQRVLVSPAWLARVLWGESKTLFCIATAIDDGGHTAYRTFRGPVGRHNGCN